MRGCPPLQVPREFVEWSVNPLVMGSGIVGVALVGKEVVVQTWIHETWKSKSGRGSFCAAGALKYAKADVPSERIALERSSASYALSVSASVSQNCLKLSRACHSLNGDRYSARCSAEMADTACSAGRGKPSRVAMSR